MKILSIHIENLASLGGKTEINFSEEPLRSAGIFAITGPTGSGKSTILDALCLALYGKTPRYKNAEGYIAVADVAGSTINQNDVRGILRDGSPGGYAAVEFVGIDEQHYRATWSVRRARNKAEGNLQAYEMALKNCSTGQDIPGKKTELLVEIERLVGLNFEEFTRSVLLAQGDFTAFLKAGKDEKSSLLEKLTGTHLYSQISKKVYENHRDEHQKLKELRIQSDGIASLSEDDLKALQLQKTQLDPVIRAEEKQYGELEKEISWHKEWESRKQAVKNAEELNTRAVADKQEAKPREDKFNQVSLVQPARGILTELQSVQKQLSQKSQEDKKLNAVIESLTKDEKIADTAFKDLQKTYETKVDQEEKAEPLLIRARALDVQLAEQDRQIKQASKVLQDATQMEGKQSQLNAEAKKELLAIEEKIAELRRWKDENQNRQSIAEHEQLILSKLKDANGILEHLAEYDKRIQEAASESTEIAKAKEDLNKQEKTVENQLAEGKVEFKALNESVSEVLIQDLEKEKASLDSSIEDLVEASAHWKLLYASLIAKTELQKNLDSKRKDLEQIRLHSDKADKLLKTKGSERAACLKMLEKAKLAAAESVDELRGKLEPDQPCPVCGSLDHPYASGQPTLDHVLSELEVEYKNIDEQYTEQLTLQSRLSENANHLSKLIEDLITQSAHTSEKLETLQENWSKFKIAADCDTLPLEERSVWLEDQLTQNRARQKHLKSEIGSFVMQKEKSDRKQKELNRLETELGKVQNEIKDIDRTLKSLKDRTKGDAAEKQRHEKNLEGLREELGAYFSSNEWFENWRAQPNLFVSRIKTFADNWKAKTNELDALSLKEGTGKEALKASDERLIAAKELLRESKEKLSDLNAVYLKLSEERKGIFGGNAVTEVETALKTEIKDAKKALDDQVISLGEIKSKLTGNKAGQKQLKNDMEALSKKETELSNELNTWIEGHNSQFEFTLDRDGLLSLLEFDQDWIENQRNSLRAIDDELTRATSVLKERKESLELHIKQRLSQRSIEELTSSKVEVQTSLNQNRKKSNEIEFKIKEDSSNKQRLGSLSDSIEKQSAIAENWSKLNEIIGSADGKKFRQIAQEYTLDVLLSYSNVHLEVLSKRYILQRIPNSLGLQVLDQDMGDEVRTVYSLSGGESFLVSLSLALGLASLSSSRMKVESLFIDEGFGSLDPATLNIAMDALERLQNQGRKVGVISHVQEMTERIPVQIKVSKQQSGRSKVEVVGY